MADDVVNEQVNIPIEPCPYCGGHVGMAESPYSEYKQITRGICGTSGPLAGTLESAIAAWNSLKREGDKE